MTTKMNVVGEGCSIVQLYQESAARLGIGKKTLSILLNLLLYINGCLLLGTGLLMTWRLPPRSGPATVLNLTRHEWGEIHLYLGLCFSILALIHLAMHWKWLYKVASQNHPWRIVFGLLIGAVLIGIPLLAP